MASHYVVRHVDRADPETIAVLRTAGRLDNEAAKPDGVA